MSCDRYCTEAADTLSLLLFLLVTIHMPSGVYNTLDNFCFCFVIMKVFMAYVVRVIVVIWSTITTHMQSWHRELLCSWLAQEVVYIQRQHSTKQYACNVSRIWDILDHRRRCTRKKRYYRHCPLFIWNGQLFSYCYELLQRLSFGSMVIPSANMDVFLFDVYAILIQFSERFEYRIQDIERERSLQNR